MLTWAHDVRRYLRVLAYLLFTLAGPFAIVFTPPSMREQIGHQASNVWGAFLMVGAATCLYGAVTDRWVGEYVGLHLLGSSLTVYATVILLTVDGEPGRLAGGFILLGVCAGMVERWFDVRAVARVAHQGARESCDARRT